MEPLVLSLKVPAKFHRFDDNRGLIYSRRFGCQHATGDAVLVLDSHIEVKPGFIEPLLQVVDENYKAIAAPVFDFWDTFQDKFFSFDGEGLGFDRYLNWIAVPNPKDGRNFRTPAIMGGAFVAKKKFLEEIDYFGLCMEGWGMENIEIAMKTWMCGGELLYVPCSRVLHYAAKRIPMIHGERRKPPSYFYNSGIVVKSFFSDIIYEDFNLATRVGIHLEPCHEAIMVNKVMLERNKCTRDFAWIRRTLMPSIESYDEETLIAHTPSTAGRCLTLMKDSKGVSRLEIGICGRQKCVRDHIRLTKWGDLRIYDRQCLDWGFEKVTFIRCHNMGGNQATGYDIKSGAIFNRDGRNWCLGLYNDSSKFVEKGPCLNSEKVDNLQRTFVVTSFKFKTVFDEELLGNLT